MSGEDFERLIEHDRYESMTRLNECKLIVEARRARASEDALREALVNVHRLLLQQAYADATDEAAAALRGKP